MMHVQEIERGGHRDRGGDAAAAFGDWRVRALFEHWRACLSPHRLPARSDLDPLAMPRGLLPHLMISQLAADGREVLRLVGTHVTKHLGFDPSWRSLDAFAGDGTFGDICRAVHAKVHETGTPVHAGAQHLSPHGVERLCERLTCPLSEDGQRIDAIVNCLVFSAPPHADPVVTGGRAEITFTRHFPVSTVG